MRVGLIGTGRMATKRAEHLLTMEGVSLVWVCSRDGGRASSFIDDRYQELGDRVRQNDRPWVESDWRGAVERGELDGLVITSPNALHYEMGCVALDAGLDLFIEYPHATKAEEGRDLLRRAADRGLSLYVGLTHRYSSAHRAAVAACRGEGAVDLGRPFAYQLTACSGNPISRWYDKDALSGGMFVSSLYHYIDETLDFFGACRSFHAAYDAARDGEGVIMSDCAALSLRFDNGVTAQLTYARGFPKPGLGTSRSFIFENGYIVSGDEGLRVLTPRGEAPLESETVDALYEDTKAFVEAVGRQPGSDATGRAAQATLELACAAQESVGPAAG